MDIMSWGGILGFFMLGDGDTERYAAGAGFNRDDRLPLEFSAPRAMYLDSDLTNWRHMRLFQTAALPEMTSDSRGETNRVEVRYAIGMGYLARDVPDDALVHFTRALQIDPRHTPSALGAGRSEFQLGRWPAALGHADGVLAREPGNSAALFLAAVAAARMDRPGPALVMLERAVELEPKNPEYAAALRVLKTSVEPGQRTR
jgi:tetratricopeptide (TPR) repeat protein